MATEAILGGVDGLILSQSQYEVAPTLEEYQAKSSGSAAALVG